MKNLNYFKIILDIVKNNQLLSGVENTLRKQCNLTVQLLPLLLHRQPDLAGWGYASGIIEITKNTKSAPDTREALFF